MAPEDPTSSTPRPLTNLMAYRLRKAALVLSRAVKLGQELVQNGEKNADKVVDAMRALIEQEPLARIDYVSAVDGLTMLPVHEINGGELIAMAVYIGKTRLIDNFSVEG